MQRLRIGLILSLLSVIVLLTAAYTNTAPLFAVALIEGRSYDQTHDTGYIDWSGSAQYVFLTHRDGTNLPPEEGGASCGSSCSEWVTRLGSGGAASGSFDRDVSYFEVMVGFSPNSSVGIATLRACSSVAVWNLYNGSGSFPGFVSMALDVPTGCRSWSISASGGYVDYRSVDVFYIGLPSTSTPTPSQTPTFTPTWTNTATSTPTKTYTPTLTFTPTFTPTNTATPTYTFTPTSTPTFTLTFTPTHTSTPTYTPTFTPTNTLTPTPTPLPPVITGQVVCDLWGNPGWCRGKETLELTASDPQGFDVTINGDLNGNPFSCGNSCSLPLPEGVGIANYSVTSASGRTASGSSSWARDATPPVLNIILPPLNGKNGWYVSKVDVLAKASDAISGLSSVAGSMDKGATWVSFPIQISDGVYRVIARARDVAGNEAKVNEMIHVDTIPPITHFTSHSNGEVVQGSVLLAGKMEDVMSGPAGGELSQDGGITWQAISMGTGDTWSFTWHTNEILNGQYILLMRGSDLAGNVSEAVSLTLVVDNGPPSVSITERWWIWESGRLKVSPNRFPIAGVKVTISDLQDRWPAVMMDFEPDKMPGVISWDRRFADGTLAPFGEYRVEAVACDIHDQCGSDDGIIAIPFMATSTATVTPSPTATLIATPQATFTATQMPATPTQVLAVASPESAQPRHSVPFWQLLGLLGLFIAIASASVIDPRPEAVDRLRETFKQISKPNIFDPSEDDN